MGLAKFVLVVAVLLAGLAYLLREPFPQGYSGPSALKLRANLAMLKSFQYVCTACETLGLSSSVECVRGLNRLAAAAAIKLNPPEYSVRSYDTDFDGIPVRVYEPSSAEKGLPGVLFLHGGGWVFSDVDAYDLAIKSLCKKTHSVFVSVDYRLAPEYAYPAAHEDSVKATKFFLKHAKQYNVDSSRIAIAGDDAGGSLAATVALKLRDEDFKPSLKMQVLLSPITQAVDFKLPSMQQNKDGPAVTRAMAAYLASAYVGGSNPSQVAAFLNNEHISASFRRKLSSTYINIEKLQEKYLAKYTKEDEMVGAGNKKLWEKVKGTLLSPYFSPLMASKLEDLPMAYVFTCEYDLWRDDGVLYALRLKEAGNNVEHFNFDIGFHSVLLLGIEYHDVHPAVQHLVDYVVNNL
jgi:acetyl esterase/lipase